MNILHVVAIYPTEENPQSGIFIKSQIESLKKEGVSCDVFLLEGEGKSKYIKNVKRLRSFLLDREYDIVHAHYAYTGWTARLATKLPLIVSFMGTDVFGPVNIQGKRTLSSKVFHRISTILLSRVSDHLIVKSTRMKNGIPEDKLSVIPNGVDLEVFSPRQVSRNSLDLRTDIKYVMFASNPDKSNKRNEKRFDIAEEAVNLLRERMPDTELIWLEKKKPAEVAKYLNAVDCLLLTSEHEGSPNVVKEALACNLPVVSRDVGDVAERIDGVQNCHITSNIPVQIADSLKQVLQNGGRAENGHQAVSDLSLSSIAKRIIELYDRLKQD